MTAATETAVQHAVRYTWPGETEVRYMLCGELADALVLMDDLAAQGVTCMEPVRRPLPEWTVDVGGLPAAVRHLAEARVDDQLSAGDVRAQLALWLVGQDVEGHAITGAWLRLCAAIRDHLTADDDGRTEDVADAEARITAAVAEIVGGEL